MIGGQHDCGAHRVKLAEITVNHGMKGQRALFFRGEFMLDVIGGRKIHHIRLPFLQDLHASGEDELGQIS